MRALGDVKKMLGAISFALSIVLVAAVPALAAQQITSASSAYVGPDGGIEAQAGSHPDFVFQFGFATQASGFVAETAKEVDVDLPPGLIANPTTVPTCTDAQLIGNPILANVECPKDSMIGSASQAFVGVTEPGSGESPLYNMATYGDRPAEFGTNIAGVIIKIVPTVRPGDHGISTVTSNIPEANRYAALGVTIWGVPADKSHDYLREGTSSLPRTAFFRLPTSCGGPALTSVLQVNSWQNPTVFDRAEVSEDRAGNSVVPQGCDRLPFDPSFSARPTSGAAGSPAGVEVSIDVPQSDDPDGLATADVRKTVVRFPRGVTLSAAAANGLGACAMGQIRLDSNAAPTCPSSSKIGTVQISTPLLDEDLEGDVILAKQRENPFGSLLAVYLAVKGPGFYLKLPGKVEADPVSGQLTTTFSDTPQLPFDQLRLRLRSGPNAPLVTPAACDTYTTQVEMTSWASDTPVPLSSPMTIDENCAPAGFDPGLRAGTANPIAGSASAFALQVTRGDGEQNIARIDATLPEGVLAKLKGVPLCAEVGAATGACPAASQVGTATVGAGAGASPVYVPEAGKAPTAVYLAGPYKGAPYSLVVKVPAQAGPFDLGTVVVRNALQVDPVTTRVTAKSDPLPQILEGIPLSYRDVRVEVSRPDFTLNPTSCDRMKVESTVVSSEGRSASPSVPFQVANCERLGFQPKLALSLSGPTHRSAHPKLRAVLTARKGDANIGRAQVTLPKTEFLENAHIQTICTRVQFAADACPAKSVYGYAKAWSPLLDKPLSGPVYLRSSNHELPDLVASLDGQIHVDLQGRIDSVRSRIRNTFDFVPDAPVSKFVLTMQGGKKGLLVNNTELCKATPRAEVALDGQNGKTADSSPLVGTDCRKGRKKK